MPAPVGAPGVVGDSGGGGGDRGGIADQLGGRAGDGDPQAGGGAEDPGAGGAEAVDGVGEHLGGRRAEPGTDQRGARQGGMAGGGDRGAAQAHDGGAARRERGGGDRRAHRVVAGELDLDVVADPAVVPAVADLLLEPIVGVDVGAVVGHLVAPATARGGGAVVGQGQRDRRDRLLAHELSIVGADQRARDRGRVAPGREGLAHQPRCEGGAGGRGLGA
jgi:hypothetical protein